MALFQRAYGYDYDQHPRAGGYRGRIGGYRGTTGGYRGTERGHGYGSRVPAAGYHGKIWEYGFDRDPPETTSYARRGRYDIGYAGPRARYDRSYGGYGEGYRRRARSSGDPYGDRQSRTPIRVVRGERRRGYRARGYDIGGGWFW